MNMKPRVMMLRLLASGSGSGNQMEPVIQSGRDDPVSVIGGRRLGGPAPSLSPPPIALFPARTHPPLSLHSRVIAFSRKCGHYAGLDG